MGIARRPAPPAHLQVIAITATILTSSTTAAAQITSPLTACPTVLETSASLLLCPGRRGGLCCSRASPERSRRGTRCYVRVLQAHKTASKCSSAAATPPVERVGDVLVAYCRVFHLTAVVPAAREVLPLPFRLPRHQQPPQQHRHPASAGSSSINISSSGSTSSADEEETHTFGTRIVRSAKLSSCSPAQRLAPASPRVEVVIVLTTSATTWLQQYIVRWRLGFRLPASPASRPTRPEEHRISSLGNCCNSTWLRKNTEPPSCSTTSSSSTITSPSPSPSIWSKPSSRRQQRR